MAEELVSNYGIPVDGIGAERALLDELARTCGHVAALGERVAELGDDELAWGLASKTERTGEDGYTETKHVAAPNVLIVMYREERTHLRRLAADVARIGIEDRLARLQEQAIDDLAGKVVGVVFGALQRLGVDHDAENVRAIVADELRAVDTADGVPT